MRQAWRVLGFGGNEGEEGQAFAGGLEGLFDDSGVQGGCDDENCVADGKEDTPREGEGCDGDGGCGGVAVGIQTSGTRMHCVAVSGGDISRSIDTENMAGHMVDGNGVSPDGDLPGNNGRARGTVGSRSEDGSLEVPGQQVTWSMRTGSAVLLAERNEGPGLSRGLGSGTYELGQELAHITVDEGRSPDAVADRGVNVGGESAEIDVQAHAQPEAVNAGVAISGGGQEPGREEHEGKEVPPSFLCPICMDIMVDPVILATGHTYDRKSIEYWLQQGNRTCPVTGMRLRHLELTQNFALRSAIHEWAAQNNVELPIREQEKQEDPVVMECKEEEGQVLRGHDEIIWALEKCGNHLITASADTTVRIWNIPIRRCVHVLEDHRRPVLSLAVTDQFIFSGSYDFTIKVWDWNGYRKVVTLRGHKDAVRALIVSDGKLFSGSYDGTIRVWTIGSWQCVATMHGHGGPVRVLTRCQGRVFSGSYDGTVRVWDTNTYKCLAVMKGHTSAVRALTSTDSIVFSGSDDTTVRAWDAVSFTCLHVLQGHQDNVRVLDATEDYLFSGSWDKTVRVWSIPSFNCVQILEGHSEAVLALTAEKDFVVSGSYDSTVRVWTTDNWRCVKRFEGHSDAVRVLSSSGMRIFSGSYDGGFHKQLFAQSKIRTMTSWVLVASRGIEAEGDSEKNIDNSTNGEVVNAHLVGGALGRSEQSILLLQEALKSREDLLTGTRRCLACGKAFVDVLKLAQHVKDKHYGKNCQASTKGDGGRSLQRQNYFSLSEVMRIEQVKKKSGSKDRLKHEAKISREVPAALQQTEGETEKSVFQGKKKRPTKLKKAYRRARIAQMTGQWQDVLNCLQKSMTPLQIARADINQEIKCILQDDSAKGNQTSWNRLQVLYQKDMIAGRALSELDCLLEIANKKLGSFRRDVEKHNRNEARILKDQFLRHDDGGGKGKDQATVANHASPLDRQTSQKSKNKEIDEFNDQRFELYQVPHVDTVLSSPEDSDTSCSTSDSDDSFDLQWGNTLQAWAQNVGHSSMKEMQRSEQPLMVEPQIEELKKGRKAEGKKLEDPSPITSAGVRILSHANPYQSHTNLEQDLSMGTEEKSDESCEKSRNEESVLYAAINAPVFIPLTPYEDRKHCDTCDVHFDSVSQWASHITSRSHQQKVMHFASQELCEGNQSSRDTLPISKLGELKIQPKTYVDSTDDLEEYVDQIITEDINNLTQNFMTKLITWQERIKQIDPKNARKKRRLVAGIREASKFAKLGKLMLVIVAPNIQPLTAFSNNSYAPKYPIDDLLATCRRNEVPIVFALSRKKMGKLLGQRKSVSLFAILDASGAEHDFHMLVQTAEKLRSQFKNELLE
eukprot:jgi/Picsp_1/3064/NSC_01286-R1_f-box wd repeat-containing protein 7